MKNNLVDGIARSLVQHAAHKAPASLKFVPQVIETRDNELLHRVLGELRALDNLLAFRYG